jgi:hypothetical protein
MSIDRTLTLLDVATRVAERLRTDPRVANFIDPAVCIAAYEEACEVKAAEQRIGFSDEGERAQGCNGDIAIGTGS